MKHKKMVLQKKDFLYSKINWEDKGFNIKQIIINLILGNKMYYLLMTI